MLVLGRENEVQAVFWKDLHFTVKLLKRMLDQFIEKLCTLIYYFLLSLLKTWGQQNMDFSLLWVTRTLEIFKHQLYRLLGWRDNQVFYVFFKSLNKQNTFIYQVYNSE